MIQQQTTIVLTATTKCVEYTCKVTQYTYPNSDIHEPQSKGMLLPSKNHVLSQAGMPAAKTARAQEDEGEHLEEGHER